MSTPDVARPSLATRLASALRGEVAADILEGLRRAGRPVHDDLAACERRRSEVSLGGGSLWGLDAGTASQLLCTWNAYVLQQLGEALLDADYAASARTVGFVPPVTAEQAARWLGQVEFWAARARRAAADPGYDVRQEVSVPAPLPPFVEVEPCPTPHLVAMLAAGRALRDHAELALFDVERGRVPQQRRDEVGRLKGLAAEAGSAIKHAEQLVSTHTPQELHERAERALESGLEAYYRLGQLLAMPELLDVAPPAPVSAPRQVVYPVPGEPGFDPWVLTAPDTVAMWRADPQARQAIRVLWASDPNPRATLAGLAEIEAALEQGALVRGAGPGLRLRHYFCCPWSSVFTVQRPVRLLGWQLVPGQEFGYDVSAEEMAEGGPFVRRLVLGPFARTEEVDYCDPTAGGHDD